MQLKHAWAAALAIAAVFGGGFALFATVPNATTQPELLALADDCGCHDQEETSVVASRWPR